MKDKIIKCQDCGNDFVFDVGEQQYFAKKGLQHEPKRCRSCRQKRKVSRASEALRA